MTPADVRALRPGMRVHTAQGEVEVVAVVEGGLAITGRFLTPSSPSLDLMFGPRPSTTRVPHHEIGRVF